MESQQRLDYLINRMLELGYCRSDIVYMIADYLNKTEPLDLYSATKHFEKLFEFVLKHQKKIS